MEIAIIIAVNLAIYWRSLSYYYVNDDLAISNIETPIAKNWIHLIWIQLTGQRYYEVLKEPSKELRGSPTQAHLISILLHTTSCCLMYYIFGANQTSFLAAILFSIHPANHQCVLWNSGKGYIYTMIICQIGMLLPPLFPALWFMAVMYNAINVAVLPLVFYNTPYWYFGILVILIPLIYKYRTSHKITYKGLTQENTKINLKKFILAFKTLGYYFMMGIFPTKLGFYHEHCSGVGINKYYNQKIYSIDKYFWIGVLLSYVVITNWKEPSVYGLIWFIINISMFCNLITISQAIAERYVYIALMGICLFLANFIQDPMILGLLIGAYLTRTWFFMPSYKNEFWTLQYGITEHPGNWKWYHERAMRKWREEDYDSAMMEWQNARYVCDYEFRIHYNLGICYIMKGWIDEAKESFDKAQGCIMNTTQKLFAQETLDEKIKLLDEIRKTGIIRGKDLVVFK